MSQTDDSSTVHKERMGKAVQLISTSPLGIGLGKYGTVQEKYVGDDESERTENWVLQVAVQTGVIGPFAYLGLTVAIVVTLLRSRQWESNHAGILRSTAAGVFVAMAVAGVMISVWDLLLPVVYAWALVGLGLATSCTPTELAIPTRPAF